MVEIVSGGVQYTLITQELYDRLLAAKDENEAARFIACENFRLWCEVNKGTHTIEEGLRACTLDELSVQFYAAGGYSGGCISNFIWALRERIREREKLQAQAISALQVEAIMPDDDEEVGNHATDND